ncbi:PucR family transcriptional regulator [Coprococcus sp. AF21-14LB]|nr:PucR family transcriptional regulator [Coprococcus sp. AF21-14LB]
MREEFCGRMRNLAITVKDVVGIAEKKGCILATGKENLDTVVFYVDGMEIPNMEAWMRPNVLYITTGYAYSGTKERLLSLVKSLNEVKAAALAIKSRFIGAYMDDFLKLAEEYQFPIIIMPEELPFVELNYAIMEALVTSRHNDEVKYKHEEANKRKSDKKLFIDFLSGNISYGEEQKQRAIKQSWPKPPYYVMLLEIEGISEGELEEQAETIEQSVRGILLEENDTSIVLYNNKIFPCIVKKNLQESNQEYFEKVQKQVAEKTGYDVLIGVSEEANSYQNFHEIYQGAMDALEIARSREIEGKVVCINKVGYWKLLKEISREQVCKEYVSRELDALIHYDKENESDLVETLESLVNHLGARNTTATSLYLHRNTLMYRIKKIEHLTGYDLSNPESILELSLALRLKKIYS